jgi:DNA-binding response OmpR family regulator
MDPTAVIWMQEPMERDLVRLILRQSGFKVVAVEDSTSLMETIKHDKPALAFLDVLLPGANGVELVGQIKSVMREKSPVIALVSALTFPEVVSRAREAGADEFFGRPLDGELLHNRIRKMVNKALSAGVKKPE